MVCPSSTLPGLPDNRVVCPDAVKAVGENQQILVVARRIASLGNQLGVKPDGTVVMPPRLTVCETEFGDLCGTAVCISRVTWSSGQTPMFSGKIRAIVLVTVVVQIEFLDRIDQIASKSLVKCAGGSRVLSRFLKWPIRSA